MSEFLKLSTDAELVNHALTNTSIDRLKKLEDKGGGFKEKPDRCDRFFRSGKSGEGAEELSIEQRLRLYGDLGEVMNRFLYTGPDNE